MGGWLRELVKSCSRCRCTCVRPQQVVQGHWTRLVALIQSLCEKQKHGRADEVAGKGLGEVALAAKAAGQCRSRASHVSSLCMRGSRS